MRFGGGLVGLLVFAGLAMWIFSQTSIPTAKVGKKAQDQAVEISGRGPDRLPAQDSVKLDRKSKGNRTVSLLVTNVVAGGALDQYFGLKKDDEITQIGEFQVRDYPGGDELAEAAVWEAAQRQQKLVVLRNGETVELNPRPIGFPTVR